MQRPTTPNSGLSRRGYLRASLVASGIALGVASSSTATAEPPGFTDRIYADNDVWATKGVADLPFPNGRNNHSFDKLFPSPGTSLLPVSEAAPGNRHYNGGRWAVHPITWHVTPTQLTSYEEVIEYAEMNKISFPADPVAAFECPLVKLND